MNDKNLGQMITETAFRAEQLTVVRAIREGLVRMIPVLIIGAFALVFKTFPSDAYQKFITGTAGGFLFNFFDLIYNATFGVLSVYMTVFISRAYMNVRAEPDIPVAGATAASVISFFMFAGAGLSDYGTDNMGPKSMFLAILTSLGASALYCYIYRKHAAHDRLVILTRGADREFRRMLTTFVPILLVVVSFALIDRFLTSIFHVNSLHNLMIHAFNKLFSAGEVGFVKGFLFVLLSSILWFFGIHGSDTLEGVMQTYFFPGLEANQAAVLAGNAPSEILTKQFFDCFVLMGGCGATICLLISILLFSRSSARRGLGYVAAVPMLFNINELMVFGLPVIYNPLMLIPFILTPLLCYTAAYFALSSGLVPMITGAVEWTTPVLIGGYYATGSIAGSLLQMVNIMIGVAVYTPFVRILDMRSEAEAMERYKDLVGYFMKNEQELLTRKITEQNDEIGELARDLAAEMRRDMINSVRLHYQPQYEYGGSCIGVESLLRWEHPDYGMMYPPLVIKLAEDGGFLADLEEVVMLRVMDDVPKIEAKLGKGIKISFNVTGTTIVTPRFLQFCRHWNSIDPFENRNLCIELTEQAAISMGESTQNKLRELHDMGLSLAIDDFSMGQTSINYLRSSIFDIIKLDGSLVKGLFTEENCREIISSITGLADAIDVTVLAEYVETNAQKEALHEIGCDCYQGWLYSPAVPIEKLPAVKSK